MPPKQPIALVILDGFGYRSGSAFNAIAQAHTPHLDTWFAQYPHCLLQASGTAVGLPEGYIGNSEVGHETIGAGRMVKQAITRILEAIDQQKLAHNKVLTESFTKLAASGHDLHIIGLLSDVGVHSHQKLLYALIDQALIYNIHHIYVHPILDGRDVAPKSAAQYLEQLSSYIKDKPSVSIGTIHGRYYAMDRDHNLDRTQKSFDVLTSNKQTSRLANWTELLTYWYGQQVTDEFIPPTALEPHSTIKPGDGIIFFNVRPDRARQLTELLLKHKKDLDYSFFITPICYDQACLTTPLFEQKPIKETLTDVMHEHHKTVFAIAETEKYAHVTYFINGGRETPYATETQILIPSLKMESYAAMPQMSAPKITQTVLESLKTDPKDLYIINYANADMVGHSGNLQATIKAIECLDKQLAFLYEQIVEHMDGTLIITADHGKAEDMFDISAHQAKTAHTTNPVPFLVISKDIKDKKEQLKLTQLADIAPYILKLMNLPIPIDMR